MKQILIIEDDEIIRSELSQFLNNAGYETVVPDLQQDMTDVVNETYPDLILLDINLPYQDGYTLCRQIRQFSQTPIIFITARDTAMDELNGLMMGGDDYIRKPYNLPVLIARIEALLRRTDKRDDVSIEYHGILLDPITATMLYNGSSAELSKTELKITYYLFQHPGKIIPRIELIEFLWDNHIHIDDNTLSVHMTRLREKMGQIGVKGLIRTKRGMGYII